MATALAGALATTVVPAIVLAAPASGGVAPAAAADPAPVEGAPEPVPMPAITDNDGDWAAGADGPLTQTTSWDGPPARAEVYTTKPSVLPGETIGLRVSTPAMAYGFRVFREAVNAEGDRAELTAYRVNGRPGHDQRGRVTFDACNTARANWQVTDTISTRGWKPGVYSITVVDINRTTGYGLIIVRTPRISSAAPLFVFPILTYEAYNYWGGASVYTTHTAVRTWRASFDRPYTSGVGLLRTTHENDLIGWLAENTPGLQFTTDYDLSLAPPARFPSVAILGRHTEYVPMAMYDWLVAGVQDLGVMGLVNFGANSLYWQVRLERPIAGKNRSLREIVVYKNDGTPGYPNDPIVGPTTTGKWRDAPAGRPEGYFMGAQYTTVLTDDGPWPGVVTADAPAWLLAGTGLVAGASAIAGYMAGEADAAYPDGPAGSTTTAVVVATPESAYGFTAAAAATIRTFASGGRIFNASTLGYPELLQADDVADTLTRNVLAWAGRTDVVAYR